MPFVSFFNLFWRFRKVVVFKNDNAITISRIRKFKLMKTIVISAYIRPATAFDVFDKNGNGNLKHNKEVFYKEATGVFSGPYRIAKKSSNFLNAEITKSEQLQYLEIYNLLSEAKMYVVDPKVKETQVHLKVKEVQRSDILIGAELIVNTAYYVRHKDNLEGPFFILKTNKTADFYKIIEAKRMYCFKEITKICKQKNNHQSTKKYYPNRWQKVF